MTESNGAKRVEKKINLLCNEGFKFNFVFSEHSNNVGKFHQKSS